MRRRGRIKKKQRQQYCRVVIYGIVSSLKNEAYTTHGIIKFHVNDISKGNILDLIHHGTGVCFVERKKI